MAWCTPHTLFPTGNAASPRELPECHDAREAPQRRNNLTAPVTAQHPHSVRSRPPQNPVASSQDWERRMQLGREIKRRLKAAIAPLIFLSLVGYFGWNAVQGNHGLVAYAQRQQILAQAQADQAQTKADKDAWDLRVSALRSRHLDADMLDERSRAMLNLANPNDIIVSYGPKDHVF